MTFSDGYTSLWLALGSNLGDSESILLFAFDRLEKELLTSAKRSRLWKSKARYLETQPDFFNAVIRGTTSLPPFDVLDFIQSVERDFGRKREGAPAKGPRTLDIDILLYNNEIISTDRLIVPHASMRDRKFVLLPMMDIDRSIVDPVSGRLFMEYLRSLPPQGIYPWKGLCYDAPYP
jgi:2-amino-4-hydroxy-6-hydroxymethyldihydropteridine diphosphokinase